MAMKTVLRAVPGAGKTHTLLGYCADDVPCLFLAYNTALATQIQTKTTHLCMTFHALCGRCLRPARDDAQLEQAVVLCETGALVPHDVPCVKRVLIDEAQDVRGVYVRLVRALGLAADDMELVVAGDARQLVYDFDPDFPASLDAIERPHLAFGGGPWTELELTESHRLTKPMASFVNATLGTEIVATRAGGHVELKLPRSMFALYELLGPLLRADPANTLLLFDRRAGNRPLRALLNALSEHDRLSIHVHGIDSNENDPTALRCLSYWSAKGLECDTAVVLVPANTPLNPLYVALTRAKRKLVVVLDPRDPHAAIARSAVLFGDVRFAMPDEEAVKASLQRSERPQTRTRTLDTAHVPRDLFHSHVRTVVERDDGGLDESVDVPGVGDVSAILVATALVGKELVSHRRVRGMEGVLTPTRFDYEQRDRAVDAGFVGRSVPPTISDASLLAPDHRCAATAAYRALCSGLGGAVEWAEVALATLAWDGFDHVMRRLRPVQQWIHHERVQAALAWAMDVLPSSAEYDTRLYGSSLVGDGHVRVHATNKQGCYHVVWQSCGNDVAVAAVRASCHPTRTCRLVALGARTVTLVHAVP